MLPINFHRTFVPERRHLSALLHYAALGRSGDYQQISAETGIPMGQSSGKVPAILDYARGMGLVECSREKRALKPQLTPLGRAVYGNDRALGTKLTQWVLHLNLCRKDIGSLLWHAAFAEGSRALGRRFTREEMESYLVGRFGPGRDRTGPALRTYLDEAALGRAGVLTASGRVFERRSAPLQPEYAVGYSALALALMDALFPNQSQVTLAALAEQSLWFDACLWDSDQQDELCLLMERKGYVAVDRQLRPWLLERKAAATEVWLHVYDAS
ncbi:MAG: hypothetical protein ACUVX9_03345 [Anaerolineae bacterium]